LVLFFKKEQKKALLFEKRSKNFLVLGCVSWHRGEAFIYRQALSKGKHASPTTGQSSVVGEAMSAMKPTP
jgi:hypothetical protein